MKGVLLPMFAISMFVAPMVAVPMAAAQTDQERSVARSTAKSGIEAYREEKYAEAVELLSRAESVVHAPTHLLFIARAHSQLGNLVEAKEAYLKVIKEHLDDGSPRAFLQAQQDAQAELETLEPRLASLQIRVSGAEREVVEVTIDGKPLPNIAIGVFTDASPGQREIVITAPGKQTERRTVELGEGQKESLAVELTAGPSDSPEAPRLVTSDAGSGSSSKKKVAGFILAGVGSVGVGVGSVFGFMTLGDAREARNDDALCPDDRCTREGNEAIDRAKTKALIANIGIGAGAALTAVGVYLVITSPKSGKEVVRLTPEAGSGASGLSLTGRY